MSSTGAVGIGQLLPQASVPAVGSFVHLRAHPLRRLDLRFPQAAANHRTSEMFFGAKDAFTKPTTPSTPKSQQRSFFRIPPFAPRIGSCYRASTPH